jgi:DNA-binding IclR family transcriptional regulator
VTSRPIDETAPLEAALPAYYIGSVGRALTLLSAFGERSSLTVSEAAQLLRVAPSTAHRLLQMLMYHGFIVQGDRREYLRGPSLRSLSSDAEKVNGIQVAAEAPLRALHDAVSGTAHVLALEGNGARFLAGSGYDDGIARTRVGWLLPAHSLAGGQVLLAQLPSAQLESLYPDGLPPERDGSVLSLHDLQERLAKVRQRGYALGRTAGRQVCAIGVAIPFHDRPARSMALSVGWPTAQFPLDDVPRTVRQLRATAEVLAGVLN